jgi:hypothetical protein
MSNYAPDDPISNTPANPRGENIHLPGVQHFEGMAHAEATGYQSEEHFGRFDWDGLRDPSGQVFEWWASYDVGNNNIVAAYLQRTRLDGAVDLYPFRLGPTTAIADADYVKVDGVRGVKFGKQIMMFLTGHKIVDSPQNHLRRMGQIRDRQITPDELWQVFPPFTGQWDDMVNTRSGQWRTWAEWLASIGAMSGSETHFNASNTEIRSHIAKIVAIGLQHVG